MRISRSATSKSILAAAAATLAISLIPTGAIAATPSDGSPATTGKVVFSDDFKNGFDLSPTGNWERVFSTDGIPSTSSKGLTVVPSGINPATGQPAFSSTAPQAGPGEPSYLDHIKFLAAPKHTASTGQLGFDIPENGSLTCTTVMSASTAGTAQNPFGKLVADPQSDLRLASGAAESTDLASFLVFNFMVTNTEIYAYYERVRQPGTTYAAFTYAVPVAKRTPAQLSTFQVMIDQHRSRVTWKLDGRTVLSVNKIGTLALDRKYMLIDGGGTPEILAPQQLSCNIGTFAILDGASANGEGLVRMTTEPNSYFAPRVGQPKPATFFDDRSLPQNRLWGQAATINVSHLDVRTTP
jgi:hypothetical protein